MIAMVDVVALMTEVVDHQAVHYMEVVEAHQVDVDQVVHVDHLGVDAEAHLVVVNRYKNIMKIESFLSLMVRNFFKLS